MLTTLLSTKFIILYIFIISTLYIHYRGQARLPFMRQLFDHSTFMAPINAFIYLFSTVPNRPYLDLKQFPELNVLQDNWQMIREEVLALTSEEQIKASQQYDDIGFNSFFKTGWKRFYLKWYGKDYLPSAEKLCPKTIALLKTLPNVKGAMFALLGKHGKLVRHRDPYAGSIRYHLGIITPNSDKCFIDVDGQKYAWKDGEAVLFDETYLHYAENDTDIDRVILFCDIERPMRFRFASAVNHFFYHTLMAASQTQNLPGDKVGVLNKLFKYLYQIRLVGKQIKSYNKHVYYTIKYSLFGFLFYLIFI